MESGTDVGNHEFVDALVEVGLDTDYFVAAIDEVYRNVESSIEVNISDSQDIATAITPVNSSGQFQYWENASFISAGLSGDTSNGCSAFEIAACAAIGAAAGGGSDEVTENLDGIAKAADIINELTEEKIKHVDTVADALSFQDRFRNLLVGQCKEDCGKQSFDRGISK
jgi:hypothetical protein